MHEIDGVTIPFQDTLNIMNGLNYAQFLEAILRIAYYKKENSDQAGNPDGFKNTLESMFADAELDLKKRAKSDEVLQKMLDLAQQSFFEENFELLGGIFSDKGMLRSDGYLELAKQDFVGVMKDAGILIIQKAEKADKKNEEKKNDEGNEVARKFDEMDVREAIKGTNSFDDEQLSFMDFLEALVKIADVYPFNEEEQANMVTFEMKMMFFTQKLEDKFNGLKENFRASLDTRAMEFHFQPRVVVDEEDDDEFDMDG